MKAQKLTRAIIAQRIAAAAGLLLDTCPQCPVDPNALMQAADRSCLPIGNPDIDKDPVARAIVIRAYAPEAKEMLGKAIDAILAVFRIPAFSPARARA
jgi:hypothetical protein